MKDPEASSHSSSFSGEALLHSMSSSKKWQKRIFSLCPFHLAHHSWEAFSLPYLYLNPIPSATCSADLRMDGLEQNSFLQTELNEDFPDR